jgi:urocanate hydratase
MSNRITAARGPNLRCKGWRQESILRMLENNLENAEKPDDLIVYAARAKAARNWDCYHTIVNVLKEIGEDETLVIQSGKPVAVFKTHDRAPIVIMANGNLVGRWATPEHFYALENKGLTMWGGYTAGDWMYIGSQGIVQGTYEVFASAARERFTDSLKGCLILTGGLGGMGGAQPLAGTMNGGVVLAVEVDPERIKRRIETGYCQVLSTDLDDALKRCLKAKEKGEALSVGLVGNAAVVFPEILKRGIIPEIVTDQTSAHDALYGYVPGGMSLHEADELRHRNPEEMVRRSRQSMAAQVKAMLEFLDKGSIVFEYGNNIRAQAKIAGVDDAFRIPIFVERFMRTMFCKGLGPFRWVAISGDESDIFKIDSIILENFPDNKVVANWIKLAREHIRFQGLPARIGWLSHGERTELGLIVNDRIRKGEIKGPIAFTRDHLDCGGVSQPYRETENMRDGSDAISDWPLLNALLNCSAMADLVAIHAGGAGYAGYYQSAGLIVIADGTTPADKRLELALTADTGIGVVRYADAGYETAIETVRQKKIRAPMV